MSAALFDIEGTILPISFVAGVLFPAALECLPSYVDQHWNESEGEFFDIKAQFPTEANKSPAAFIEYCNDLNARNLKFPPWKTLQGLLWRKLYDDGTVKAPLYDDVYSSLRELKDSGIAIYIYSSGSIEAQKLLFEHTNHGDISDIIAGYFDPPYLQVANKADLKGYQAIFKETGIEKWIFFSDVTKEVEAAEEAGMTAYVVVREGNAPLTLSDVQTHKMLYSLSGIVELFN